MDTVASVKVLFLSQQRLLRDAFTTAFSEFPDLQFMPTVDNVDEAVASIRHSEPDIILVDLNPSLFGVKVAKQLQEACPGCKILMLASYSDPITEAQLASVGVKGVLCKSIGLQELAWAVREASAGKWLFMNEGKASAVEPSQIRLVSSISRGRPRSLS